MVCTDKVEHYDKRYHLGRQVCMLLKENGNFFLNVKMLIVSRGWLHFVLRFSLLRVLHNWELTIKSDPDKGCAVCLFIRQSCVTLLPCGSREAEFKIHWVSQFGNCRILNVFLILEIHTVFEFLPLNEILLIYCESYNILSFQISINKI